MQGVVHVPFRLAFQPLPLALGEAPGSLDLLSLLVPSFPFQRYSVSEKLPHTDPSGYTHSPLVLTASLIVVRTDGVWYKWGVIFD